jgi:hypothetical protein
MVVVARQWIAISKVAHQKKGGQQDKRPVFWITRKELYRRGKCIPGLPQPRKETGGYS